jgi:hypothetical protein
VSKITKIKYSDLMSPVGGVDEYHDAALLASNRVQAASNVYAKDGALYKRPGRRLWGPEFDTSRAFRGLKEYVDSDGTARLIVAHGRKVYNVTGAAATELDDVTDEQDLHFHSLRGLLYYNGASVQRKLSSDTASAVGLDKPDTTPGAATNGAGSLTGSYSYKVTFVIEVDDARAYESDPCTATDSVEASSNAIALSSVPVSDDTRVTHRYIYRTTASGAMWFYVGKIADNTTTTYDDDGSVSDAEIGAAIETTHGVPTQAEFACGANERQFWAKGDTLYYSEAAYTVAYLEYAKSTNFHKLPGTGAVVGLRALYNIEIGREDLYILQEDAISILPGGDPKLAPRLLRSGFGGYHDTIAEYNGALVFLNTKGVVCVLVSGRVLDISTRNIPVSMAAALHQEGCRGAVIFDHYYALTTEVDAGKLYNHRTWVCDMRTLKDAGSNAADAVWFPWDTNVDYWVQRLDGTVLALDNSSKRIYQYSAENSTDEDSAGGTYTAIDNWIRTPNFMMKLPMALKRPLVLSLHGRFHRTLRITPYYWRNKVADVVEHQPIASAFVMGQSTMGSPTTTVKVLQEAVMPTVVCGNMFSFKIESTEDDAFFELGAYQFTYQMFGRGLA